jgi:hypothetical protein
MLTVQNSWSVALEEASALCHRATGAGAGDLLAVDDERCAVARSPAATGGLSGGVVADLTGLVPGGVPASGSNFEGVAADDRGRVFVLQESDDRILVFDPAMEALEGTITLTVAADEPGFGSQWHADDNARGEGLLLLGDGHVLVGKQKKPVRLIEFGPAGDAPSGFVPGAALAPGAAFPIAAGDAELRVLASWPLANGTPLESINDLAVDEHGRLFVVSSKSRAVARLETDLEPTGGDARFTVWPLPAELFETDDDKAEGLTFVPGLGWLVALDLGRLAPNLFSIDGIPATAAA